MSWRFLFDSHIQMSIRWTRDIIFVWNRTRSVVREHFFISTICRPNELVCIDCEYLSNEIHLDSNSVDNAKSAELIRILRSTGVYWIRVQLFTSSSSSWPCCSTIAFIRALVDIIKSAICLTCWRTNCHLVCDIRDFVSRRMKIHLALLRSFTRSWDLGQYQDLIQNCWVWF